MITAQSELKTLISEWERQLESDFKCREAYKKFNSDYDYSDIKTDIQVVRDLRRCLKYLNEVHVPEGNYP